MKRRLLRRAWRLVCFPWELNDGPRCDGRKFKRGLFPFLVAAAQADAWMPIPERPK